jgi:hypothetical protein
MKGYKRDVRQDVRGYFPEELHIDHVTNGVHFPLGLQWIGKEFMPKPLVPIISCINQPEYWGKIYQLSDEVIWAEECIRKKANKIR